MQNDEKIAAIAFLNARESPRKYANGVYDLVVDAVLAAAKGEPVSLATDNGDEGDGSVTTPDAPDYAEYVGRYVRGMGDSETAVVHWRGSIAMLRLPTDNPRSSLTELEHVSGDTFRQVVDDEDSGVIFDRDAQGRIIRVRNPTNYSTRIY
ncbi:MAG TPA: DUF3471 domain-containing protein [Gemmatimonadetes bacterium]|nr:DUF3471 domain-containing protein [Gemmatimonadota bacterium]